MPESTRSFLIRRRDGSEHSVLLDADDFERAMAFWPRWCISGKGYVYSSRSWIYLHRFVLELTPSDPPVDHVNGIKLDNRRCNLRLSTTALNVAHQRVVNGRGTSKYRGVFRRGDNGRWGARQKVNYESVWLGAFGSEEEAAEAVARFREEHGLPPGY